MVLANGSAVEKGSDKNRSVEMAVAVVVVVVVVVFV